MNARNNHATKVSGYAHQAYAASFDWLGTPRPLVGSGSWIIERKIAKSSYTDAMGCYPLFSCLDWSKLSQDLDSLEGSIVSLALVTDPFGKYSEACLREAFKDVVKPFKEHFIIDMNQQLDHYVSKHHQRYAKRKQKDVSIEKCERPLDHLAEWVRLYAILIERRHIRGVAIFSEEAFLLQLSVPGIIMFKAIFQGETIGMLLWYRQGNVAYYHLGAYCEKGYEIRVSYALFWFAIEYFAANGLSWLNLGAGAGTDNTGEDGLSRFKRGWSTGARTVYFCGRIFDREQYERMAETPHSPEADYFPIYRKGEFR